jgi:3-oxoacyl-[acyl-carrier protein] reductase
MKKILILGASSDIGLSLLETIKDQDDFMIGAHCFKGEKRIKNLVGQSIAEIKVFKKNLQDKSACENLVKNYLNWSKGIDILVQLNGEISNKKSWENLDEKNWKRDIAINLSAPFFASQLIFKQMKKKGGKIVFTSTSSADRGGGSDTAGYGIAKAGLMALTKILAKQGGKFKIKVNCVAPGFILTRLHLKKLKKNKQEIINRKKLNVLNTHGEPQEVANLIKYLISDETNFITGEIIKVDGGDWL